MKESDDATTKKCLELLHKKKMDKWIGWVNWLGLNKGANQKQLQ